MSIQPSGIPLAGETVEGLMRRHRARRTFQWANTKALDDAMDPDAGYRGKPHTRALTGCGGYPD